MAYTVADADDVEGRFKKIRAALGVSAFGINQVDLPAGFDGYPDHDELETGHEEVFYCLRGSGTIRVDGDEIELAPGRVVRVTPESSRKIVAGADGISVLAIGAPAGARGKGWSAL